MRDRLIAIANWLLDIIFPRRCAICDKVVAPKELVCKECRLKIKTVCDPICMKCGKMLSSHNDMYCYDCKRTVKHFDRGFAVFEYDYIKNSLYRFKYSRRAEYSRFYADLTVKKYGDVLKRLGIEVLIPVPIHKKRERKRGYNQAYEYAKDISKLVNIPVENKLIIRRRNTIPLKALGPLQRQKNLKKAFKLTRNDVKFRRVCIVDDIYTTGATISCIASLLKEAGVEEVYFVTVAIGHGL